MNEQRHESLLFTQEEQLEQIRRRHEELLVRSGLVRKVLSAESEETQAIFEAARPRVRRILNLQAEETYMLELYFEGDKAETHLPLMEDIVTIQNGYFVPMADYETEYPVVVSAVNELIRAIENGMLPDVDPYTFRIESFD